MSFYQRERQNLEVHLGQTVCVESTDEKSLNAGVNVCQEFSEEAAIQCLNHSHPDKVMAQTIEKVGFAHAVKIAVFTRDETDDPAKVFDLR